MTANTPAPPEFSDRTPTAAVHEYHDMLAALAEHEVPAEYTIADGGGWQIRCDLYDGTNLLIGGDEVLPESRADLTELHVQHHTSDGDFIDVAYHVEPGENGPANLAPARLASAIAAYLRAQGIPATSDDPAPANTCDPGCTFMPGQRVHSFLSGIHGYVIPCSASQAGHRDLRFDARCMTHLVTDYDGEQLIWTENLRPGDRQRTAP